jgi:serine/threonine-protein kinase
MTPPPPATDAGPPAPSGGVDDLAPGDVVADRYRLERPLNAGGSSQVWVARDQRLDREVALKRLKPDLAASPQFLERFRKEAQNSARLRHANIATLLDHGRTGDGGAYLTHELVSGHDLADILSRRGRLEVDQTVRVLVQVLAGLQAAHAAGVVHRDIKPANVLVSARGTVKLTDFGISRAVGQSTLTRTGMVMGTPEYLAPELARGGPASPAADLYAVGVLAFESLTGHRPFGGEQPIDLLLAHVTEPVPDLPGVPEPMGAGVRDLLAKHPADRPTTASDAVGRLRSALGDIRTPRPRSNPSLGRVTRTATAADDQRGCRQGGDT